MKFWLDQTNRFVATLTGRNTPENRDFLADDSDNSLARSGFLMSVSEEGGMAKALNYARNGRSVDAAMRFSHQFCHNCARFSDVPESDAGACSVFAGKRVAPRGWCRAWVPGKLATN